MSYTPIGDSLSTCLQDSEAEYGTSYLLASLAPETETDQDNCADQSFWGNTDVK